MPVAFILPQVLTKCFGEVPHAVQTISELQMDVLITADTQFNMLLITMPDQPCGITQQA
jgi:hypothetical protein